MVKMEYIKSRADCIRAFGKWFVVAVIIGIVCGLAGALFAHGVQMADSLRRANDWLIWLLPVGGLVIAGLYKISHLELYTGADDIMRSVRTQEKVPIAMAPVVFVSTVITHLLGGSAGREGAAQQLGGSIGAWMGDHVPHKMDDRRIFELCGMAALFAALFGTPFTAAFFVLEVMRVGEFYYRALFPCAISALTAALLAGKLGVHAEVFAIAENMAALDVMTIIRAIVLAALCAFVGVIFCNTMHLAPKIFKKLIPSDFLRIFAAGLVIAAVTMISGTRDYNGSGMSVVSRALLEGQAAPWAFALKIFFTGLTIGAGFKGGEIVPSFFIGATFGCFMGGILGINPALGAAMGLIAVFCGVTNTPAASLILSAEMFGAEYLPLFGVAVAVSHMLSGHVSLYHAQTFKGRKLGFEIPGKHVDK